LTEGVFEHLGPLNQLRDLDLDAFAYGVPAGWTGIFRTPWTVSGLSKLKGFKSLTRLNLRGGEVVGDDECALIARQFPALEFLSVACCQKITDAGIRSLAGLRQLKELRAYGLGSAMTGKGFDAFGEHTALTHLDVGLLAEIDDSGLAAVAAIPKLSRLHLYHGELTENGYAHLSKAVHLRELTTAHEGFGPKALEAISKCTQLQVLRILNASKIRSDDYKLLCRFSDLRELRILGDAYHLSDAAMEHLRGLTSLRRLTLIDAPISNSGLLALKDLKNLTQLQIEGQADFSDALDGLKALEALENLRLDNCKGIGPKAVRDIASLPRLRDLTITFPEGLTGKALLPLKDAPALRSVQVWGKVDELDEGMAALSKAAPLIAATAGYRGH
jgi:hypothetical protein